MSNLILINGATGNIGKRVAETLLAKGFAVRVTARNAEKLAELQKKGAEVFQGELTDADFVNKAFEGVHAAFTLLPPNMQAADIMSYQDSVTNNYVNAIKNNKTEFVINLSSVGGHTTEGNGAIAGLARQETALNNIDGLNVINIRAAFFMENAFWGLDLIKNMNMNGSATEANAKMPMIATQDIADFVSEKLSTLNFNGKNTQALLGPEDLSMQEYTSILGNKIGKTDLQYMQFPAEQAKQSMVQMGMSESVADGMIGIQIAAGTELLNQELRDEHSTTKTKAEDFANTFAYVYNLNQ